MATAIQNPYVKIEDEIINISYSKQRYSVALNNVRKMYLSKKKTNYMLEVIGKYLFSFGKSTYKLNIKTKDEKEIVIRINALEKQYFIGLISFVRSRNKKTTWPERVG